MTSLDTALLAAHETGDLAALVGLYHQAAIEANAEDAAGFYLTHAYVFALERGDTRAETIRAELIRLGRETVDQPDMLSASA